MPMLLFGMDTGFISVDQSQASRKSVKWRKHVLAIEYSPIDAMMADFDDS
jgi:hypothetical protein